MQSAKSSQSKTLIMSETAQHLISMIQKRNASRTNALNALHTSPMDGLPDEVVRMREIESASIRAVMQEQIDLIEIISMLFPPVKPQTEKKKTTTRVKKNGKEKE